MFYVAHRLFAAHDRALGAFVARRLADKVGPESVFLPFCDTNEEDLVADVNGRRLYELDRQRLANLSGLLAVLHGPSLDDGVCMELGYAAALAVPTGAGPWTDVADAGSNSACARSNAAGTNPTAGIA